MRLPHFGAFTVLTLLCVPSVVRALELPLFGEPRVI